MRSLSLAIIAADPERAKVPVSVPPGELCDGFLEGLNVAAHVTLQLHGGKDSE